MFLDPVMNWPIVEGWKCQICGCSDLEKFRWGYQTANFYCSECGVFYYLKDYSKINFPIVTTPIISLQARWIPVYQKIWERFKLHFSKINEETMIQTSKELYGDNNV